MIRIACMGDNVVDINYIDGMIYPGGNCVNVAAYCSQMGHQAAYVGVLGDDIYASIVTDALDTCKVSHDRCVVLHGETGRCPCELIDGERVLSDENDGGLVKSDPLVITQELVEYLKTFDIVHTSCYSYLDDQLYKLKEAGIPLLYDFSMVWTEEDVAKVAPVSDFILFSGKDELTQEENLKMLKDAVDRYHCGMAIMTMGIEGAWVYDGKKVYQKAPYNVDGGAIDTTGCGDSWISGFITTYIEVMGRMERMKDTADEAYIMPADIEDVSGHAIEMGMVMGNLKARHTCRRKGAFGCGVPIKK